MDLTEHPVLVTTTNTHLVFVRATDPDDAVAQIRDSDGADLDQLLDRDTVMAGDFAVRAPVSDWDQRMVADHIRSHQRRTGPAAA